VAVPARSSEGEGEALCEAVPLALPLGESLRWVEGLREPVAHELPDHWALAESVNERCGEPVVQMLGEGDWE
jgi:hypothetical protein